MLADQSPLVSVVTTAFQAEAHVARALRSASLLDTDAPMEIILFDDGSTDGTLAAARAEAEADPRIRVIEGGRQGRARALNLAIRAAKGRYIAILDAAVHLGGARGDHIRRKGAGAGLQVFLPDRCFSQTGAALIDRGSRRSEPRQQVRLIPTVRAEEPMTNRHPSPVSDQERQTAYCFAGLLTPLRGR